MNIHQNLEVDFLGKCNTFSILRITERVKRVKNIEEICFFSQISLTNNRALFFTPAVKKKLMRKGIPHILNQAIGGLLKTTVWISYDQTQQYLNCCILYEHVLVFLIRANINLFFYNNHRIQKKYKKENQRKTTEESSRAKSEQRGS